MSYAVSNLKREEKLGAEKSSSPFLLDSRQHHLNLYAMTVTLPKVHVLFWTVVAKKKTAQ